MMRENNVGSVLVMADSGDNQLIGIFTERDLLKKIELIQKGGHWLAPVRTVMTAPVKTLEASKIHLAPKMMLQFRFRHIPIVTLGADQKERVVGIVSMRDIFKTIVLQQEKLALQDDANKDKPPSKMRVSLISKNETFSKFLEQTFASMLSAKIKKIKIDEDYGDKLLTIIFDIDSYPKEVWPNRLLALNKDPTVKLIIVAMDPSLHSPELLATIEKLGKSKKFWIFRKPLEIFDLINRLTT